MEIQQEIERLAGRSWRSAAELIGAIRFVVGSEEHFDCLEADGDKVVIRRQAVGKADGFELCIPLTQRSQLAA